MTHLFTIGHSNHPVEVFRGLLRLHGIEVVADTRSYPQSKYATQYDEWSIKRCLRDDGVKYLFLGRELGGRPKDTAFYDDGGHVLYSRVAESPEFLEGLSRIESGIREFRVALLCSEEDPSACHRRLLIGRVLLQRGVSVDHIRGDGRLQSESDLLREESEKDPFGNQLSLFECDEPPVWKSTLSVLLRRQQSSFSAF